MINMVTEAVRYIQKEKSTLNKIFRKCNNLFKLLKLNTNMRNEVCIWVKTHIFKPTI